MAYWIIKANPKLYNHLASFEKRGYIDWKQNHYNVEEGDVVYVYFTEPYQRIMVKGVVEKVNLKPTAATDDYEFWIDKKKYYTGKKGLYMRIRKVDKINTSKLSLRNLVIQGMSQTPSAMTLLGNLSLTEYIDNEFRLKEEDFTAVETSRYIPKHIKVFVYNRDEGACVYCGSKDDLHYDHILPVSKGGTSNNPKNIQLLCQKCNLSKSDKIE